MCAFRTPPPKKKKTQKKGEGERQSKKPLSKAKTWREGGSGTRRTEKNEEKNFYQGKSNVLAKFDIFY